MRVYPCGEVALEADYQQQSTPLSQHKYRSKMFGHLGFTTPKVTWPWRRPASLCHSRALFLTRDASVFNKQLFEVTCLYNTLFFNQHNSYESSNTDLFISDPTTHCRTNGGQQMWPFYLDQMLRKNEPFTVTQCFRKPYFPPITTGLPLYHYVTYQNTL